MLVYWALSGQTDNISLRGQHAFDGRFFVVAERGHLSEGGEDFGFEIPAGHLAEREPPGKFISGDLLFSFTYMPGHIERLADGKLAVVENRAGGGRFFGFAFGTPAGVWCFAGTGIGVAAFPAGETLSPLKCRQKLKAGVIAGKELFELVGGQCLVEDFSHDQGGVSRVIT